MYQFKEMTPCMLLKELNMTSEKDAIQAKVLRSLTRIYHCSWIMLFYMLYSLMYDLGIWNYVVIFGLILFASFSLTPVILALSVFMPNKPLLTQVKNLMAKYQAIVELPADRASTYIHCVSKSPWQSFSLGDWAALMFNPIEIIVLCLDSGTAMSHYDVDVKTGRSHLKRASITVNLDSSTKGKHHLFTLLHEVGHIHQRYLLSNKRISEVYPEFVTKARLLSSTRSKNKYSVQKYLESVYFTVFSELHADLHALYWIKRLCSKEIYESALAYHKELRSFKEDGLGVEYVTSHMYAHVVRALVDADYSSLDDAFYKLIEMLSTPDVGAWGALIYQADRNKLERVMLDQYALHADPSKLVFPWVYDKDWDINTVLPVDPI